MVIAGRLAPARNNNPSGNHNPNIWQQHLFSFLKLKRWNKFTEFNLRFLACSTQEKVYLQSGPRLVKEKISWQWQCTGKQHKRPNVRRKSYNLPANNRICKIENPRVTFIFQNWSCSKMRKLRNSSPMCIIILWASIIQNS